MVERCSNGSGRSLACLAFLATFWIAGCNELAMSDNYQQREAPNYDAKLAYPQGGDPGSLLEFPAPSTTKFLGASASSCGPLNSELSKLTRAGYEEVVSGFNDDAISTQVWRRSRDTSDADNLLVTVEGGGELCRITTLDEQSAPAG